MAKQMPPAKNISALGFRDYVRLRRLVKADGKQPTIEVTQHNSETVTYKEAYEALEDTIVDLQHYATRLNEYNSDLISTLCAYLYSKKIITKQDMDEIANNAMKIWKEAKNDEEN